MHARPNSALGSASLESGQGGGLLHPRRGLPFVEVVDGFEVHAARVLAHPDRRDGAARA
jgi:hypothetical protein